MKPQETDLSRLSTTKRESPPASPRTIRQTHNMSSISNNNISAIHEDENLIRERSGARLPSVPPSVPAKPRLSLTKEEKPKRYSLQKDIPIFSPSRVQKSLVRYLSSRPVEVFILGLILIYTLLVLVNIVLDDGSNTEAAILQGLDILKYVELGILVIFILEIMLRVCAFGVKGYYKDLWYVMDTVIIMITFALVIVDIVLEDERIGGLSRVRGLFRLFRIFLLLRKANEISRITKPKFRSSGIDFKSPVEKVLELLETFKANTNDKLLKKDLEWAIEIVSTNKLYEPIIEGSDAGKADKTDVNLWLKSYGPQQQTKEEISRFQKRRSSIMPATLSKNISKATTNNFVIPAEATELLEKTVNELHFNIMEFRKVSKEEELSVMMLYLFERHNFFESLNIEQDTFMRFIRKIQSGYLPNPYHNSTHAADVVQTTNYLLTTGELLSKAELNNLEVASLLIGAAIHDYDHPGTNNAYHIGTASKYAIRYNDRAVLESHHVASTFALLQDESYNIFAKFNKDDYKNIRERIIAIVLATDMSNHFTDIAKLKGRLAADFDLKQKDKKFAMELAVHTADISNPSKPWDTCREWTVRVVTEFWEQGDKERELGLPITYLCDRYTVNLAKSQLGFIDFVVAPLFGLMKEILPNMDISNLETNKNKWKEFIDHYEEELRVLNEKKNGALVVKENI